MRDVAILIGCALTLWSGCSKQADEPRPAPAGAASVQRTAEVSAPEKSAGSEAHPAVGGRARGGLKWTDPEGWRRVSAGSPMRKASYRVPRVGGDPEDAELRVFYFGPQGAGGIEANVKRWAGQFGDVPESEIKRIQRTVHGLVQHVVEIESGRYATDMPMGTAPAPSPAKEGYGLLAAIVEHAAGPYFFKMTGPARTIQANREAFMALLDTVRPDQQ